MTTPFKQALDICGLSQSEAADYFDVRLDTVKSWCTGRNPVRDGAWDSLRDLYETMVVASEESLALIEEKQPDKIEFNYSGNHGKWPSAKCALTVEAMVMLGLTYHLKDQS